MRDLRVQWTLFVGVGVFIAIGDVVYWYISYEQAGTTMLALSSALALFCGGWLYLQDRRATRDGSGPEAHPEVDQHELDEHELGAAGEHRVGEDRVGEDRVGEHELGEHYLPAASWWPLLIALGIVVSLNGLILSWPYAMPGGALLIAGIGGLISESRRRA